MNTNNQSEQEMANLLSLADAVFTDALAAGTDAADAEMESARAVEHQLQTMYPELKEAA